MIVDRLARAAFYRGLEPGIAAALEYLQQTDVAALEDGRHPVSEGIVAIVQRYAPKPMEEAVWEAHRKHIDVQFVAHGREVMGWRPLTSSLRVHRPYDEGRDVEFYEEPRGSSWISVEAGAFAIFGPEDVHAPGLAPAVIGEGENVLKVVVKVPVPLGER